MRCGRWLAAALAVGTLAAAPLAPEAVASTAHRGISTPPDGLVDGTPHVVRVRPVLATLGAAPRTVPRPQLAAAEAAIASCDPAQVDALPRVPTTRRKDDVASACVVLPEHPGRRRAYLGPARVSGDGIETVSRRPVRTDDGRRFELVLRMTVRGATLDVQAPPQYTEAPAVLDLDGEIVGDADVEGSPEGKTAAIIVTPRSGGGFSRKRADELLDRIRQARAEQLIDITRQATFTRRARELLAATDAELTDKDDFNRRCPNAADATTLILGCYTGDRIHVLRVDRPDLAGAMTVALAHEMLHAAFDELSPKERREVVDQLEAFMRDTGDPRIEELLAEYERLEPGARDTELHSLVGTQVADLPMPLERYYAKLFTDRSRTVEAFAAYQSVFDNLRIRYEELRAQVEALEAQIVATESEYHAAGAEADRLYEEIEALRDQGRIDESNRLVGAQNAAADRANALADQYNSLVGQYNALIDELNLLAVALNESYNAISPVPIELPVES